MPPGLELPTGTVTFLFTDIEGSTRLLQALGEGYGRLQEEHAEIIRTAAIEEDGVEVRTEGDSFFLAFPTAAGAVRAAVTAQRELARHDWPAGGAIRVRMGIHTGEGVLGGGDYIGIDVNVAARIAAAGHGGQVLVSDATRVLVEAHLPDGVALRMLGSFRLKDVDAPRALYDLAIEGAPTAFPPPRTAEVPWNVPEDRTRFVGRRREVERLAELIGASRLVTLTGAGGSGKTRLAKRAAEEVRDGHRDGVVFVDLSSLSAHELVASSIAVAAGVTEEGGTPIEETLRRELRSRELLVVLDNFEQVLDAAPTVAGLLDAAPGLRMLVTSRIPLRVAGEQEFPVPPLGLPDPAAPLDRLEESESVALFVDRARGVDPSFVLDDQSAAAVAELCARLDGLPLAIELAASRVRALSPSAILERLAGRLHRIEGGPRDAPARHRTLSEAIRWSDELLPPAASAMLRRLAVFAGGWTLSAADAVANPDGELGADTVEVMEILLEHGLIRREEPRFRMLDTVRAYALDALGEDAEDVARRHALVYLEVAERANRQMIDPPTLAEIGAEHDNLRAALRWSREHDLPLGLRIGAALWRFWHLRGHLAEGRATLGDLLASPEARDPAVRRERAAALVALAGVVYWQNDYAAARAAYEEARDIAREIGADAELGDAIYGLSYVERITGDMGTVAELHREARSIFERIGDARRLAALTMAEGMMAHNRGDLEGAETMLREALRLFVDLGDLLGAATSAGGLGQAARRKGNQAEAVSWYLRSTEYGIEIGDHSGLAVALQGLAMIAGERADHEAAVLLWAAGERLGEVGGARAPAEFLELEDVRGAAEAALGAEETERLWRHGLALAAEQAVDLARERFGAAR